MFWGMTFFGILPTLAGLVSLVGGVMNILRQDPDEVSGGAYKWRQTAAKWLLAHRWTRYLGSGLLFIGGIGIGLWIWPLLYQPSPVIRTEFRHAHTQYPQLGKPLDNAILTTLPNKNGGGFAQAQFDKAWLFWLDNPGKLYAVPLRGTDHPFTDDDDNSFGIKWANSDEEIRKRPAFRDISNSCKLPSGGFAVSWDARPDEWSWIGCGVWYCQLDGSGIYYQDFERGRMIGPVRLDREDNATAEIFILFKDGTSHWTRSYEHPPAVRECSF